MASKISYQTWDGGEGWNRPVKLIGYCKESTQEVLKLVLLTHDVYTYLGLYRPIDYNFPNNVMGLIISDAHENITHGVVVTGSFSDLNCDIALTKHERTKEIILDSLDKCRKWHTYPTNKVVNDKYQNLIDTVEVLINETL